ncbi:MAG: CYTH domain-containing protein [Paludibacteraceae bacterium]|nr:CYTH domain-containing protein [Paludibacteraceae bacterium]
MAKEIERKFLVRSDAYKQGGRRKYVKQGYLCFEAERTVRVRVTEEEGVRRGFLTVKGKNKGIERTEYEYEIAAEDAEEMIEGLVESGTVIEKWRWTVEEKGGTWEVDEFKGRHEGLVIAEVELKNADEEVALPEWVGEEVSGDARYYNSNLAKSSK